MLIGIGIVTLVALLLLGYTGYANYRKLQHIRRIDIVGNDMGAFFAINSMMLSAVSAIALAWVAFPALLLPPCAA